MKKCKKLIWLKLEIKKKIHVELEDLEYRLEKRKRSHKGIDRLVHSLPPIKNLKNYREFLSGPGAFIFWLERKSIQTFICSPEAAL